jgi:hypothetical protein
MKKIRLICLAFVYSTSLFCSHKAKTKPVSQYAQKHAVHRKVPHHIQSLHGAAAAASQTKAAKPNMIASYNVEQPVLIQPATSLRLIDIAFDVGEFKAGSAHCIIRIERFDIPEVVAPAPQGTGKKAPKTHLLSPTKNFKTVPVYKKTMSVQIQYYKKHADMLPQMRKNAIEFLANYGCKEKNIHVFSMPIA